MVSIRVLLSVNVHVKNSQENVVERNTWSIGMPQTVSSLLRACCIEWCILRVWGLKSCIYRAPLVAHLQIHGSLDRSSGFFLNLTRGEPTNV